MTATRLTVNARWDGDAGVWWASSDDVPGLATEAPTWGQLLDNVRELVPSLIQLNRLGVAGEVGILTIAQETSILRFTPPT